MNKKSGFFIVIVILFAVIGLIGYFLRKNTGVIAPEISKQAINENNFNTEVPEGMPAGDGADLANLLEKEVIVPEKYRQGVFSAKRAINLPANFSISVFAAGMRSPRAMAFSDPSAIFVTDIGSGEVKLLRDRNNDGEADEIITVDRNLRRPHGIELYENDLYVAEEHQVVVYRDMTDEGNYDRKEIIIPNLPSGQGHSTRTVKIGPDQKIYLSIGSSCNLCEESDSLRAAVVRYNSDGSFDRTIGTGLRNSVGIVFRETGSGFELWGVDNGRDLIGDNIPPEEANLIYTQNQEETKNFGWPYCYGDGVANPEYPERSGYCANETEFPRVNMQAHSAPLGIAFIPKNDIFPGNFQDNMLVTFHGSWNRSIPTGYKLVRIGDKDSREPTDFITGWLDASGKVWGRPVDVKIAPDGTIFITDDQAGAVYLIRYGA